MAATVVSCKTGINTTTNWAASKRVVLCNVRHLKSHAMNSWNALKSELHREARAIYFSTGEFVSIAGHGDSALLLGLGTNTIKVTHVPDRNAAKWEMGAEYGFERLDDRPTALATLLIRKVRLGPLGEAGSGNGQALTQAIQADPQRSGR